MQETTTKQNPVDTLGRNLRDLRISVMDRCNFRCPYCMPEHKYNEKFKFLSSKERLGFDEIVRLASLFTQLGVTKLRITGGEPLLRPDLPELIGDLTMLPGVDDIALTTNGVLLAQRASALKAAGLNRVTVSLDTLDDDVFLKMNGNRGGKHHVLEGINEAMDAGLTPLKINTVIQRGVNDHTALDLVDHFRGTGVIVRFIEFMDVGTINHWQANDTVPSAELLEMISSRWPTRPIEKNYAGEVANRYCFEDGQGEIGFVSSVSKPFCGGCNRARISSDGKLYTCLFANIGKDLRTPLRDGASDDELLGIICGTWKKRNDSYSELRATNQKTHKKVEMYYIGG